MRGPVHRHIASMAGRVQPVVYNDDRCVKVENQIINNDNGGAELDGAHHVARLANN